MTTAREAAAMELAVKHQCEFIVKGATPEQIEQCLWNAVESGFLLGKAVGVLEGMTSRTIEAAASTAPRGEQNGSNA